MEFELCCVQFNFYWGAFSTDSHLKFINSVDNILALGLEFT